MREVTFSRKVINDIQSEGYHSERRAKTVQGQTSVSRGFKGNVGVWSREMREWIFFIYVSFKFRAAVMGIHVCVSLSGYSCARVLRSSPWGHLRPRPARGPASGALGRARARSHGDAQALIGSHPPVAAPGSQSTEPIAPPRTWTSCPGPASPTRAVSRNPLLATGVRTSAGGAGVGGWGACHKLHGVEVEGGENAVEVRQHLLGLPRGRGAALRRAAWAGGAGRQHPRGAGGVL